MSIRIRQEEPADYAEVYALVKAAFTVDSPGEGEWDYLNEVRKKPSFIPDLSLVAVTDEHQIVGQIVLYETAVTTDRGAFTALVLSPLSVHPDYFRQGIARAMMTYAFVLARHMGYTAVFLCGDPLFYCKMGFRPSSAYGIYHIADETHTAEWCMALELTENALKNIRGTIDIL